MSVVVGVFTASYVMLVADTRHCKKIDGEYQIIDESTSKIFRIQNALVGTTGGNEASKYIINHVLQQSDPSWNCHKIAETIAVCAANFSKYAGIDCQFIVTGKDSDKHFRAYTVCRDNKYNPEPACTECGVEFALAGNDPDRNKMESILIQYISEKHTMDSSVIYQCCKEYIQYIAERDPSVGVATQFDIIS